MTHHYVGTDAGSTYVKVTVLYDADDIANFAMNDKFAAAAGRFLRSLTRVPDVLVPERLQCHGSTSAALTGIEP